MQRFIVPAAAALFLAAALLFGCSRQSEQPRVASGTANQQSPSPADADSMPAHKTAMIDWCIVSGEPLGGMGNPVSYKYKDREMRFCCKNCVKEFEANPVVYLQRLDSAQAGLIGPPVKRPS